MNTRHFAYLGILLLVACSGGGGFVPRKDGGTTNLDLDTHSDGNMNSGDMSGCSAQGLPCGKGCCQGLLCMNGTCMQPNTCKSGGTSCTQGDNCCNNLVCNSADNVCEACGMTNTHCAGPSDCCNGYSCNIETGFCQQGQGCKQPGNACNQTPDCCSGICNSSTLTCGTCGSTVNSQCASDLDCCGNQGWSCNLNSGFCQMQQMGCGNNGQGCNMTVDCCQGLYCINNSCTNAPQCKVIGGTCNSADVNGYTVCCDSVVMNCINNQCCIDAMYQDVSVIKCHSSAECCSNQVCNVNAGTCM